MRPGTAHLLFAKLIDWHLRSDHDGWPDTSIFYRMVFGGGRETPGHRILCRDMDRDTLLIQRAFNDLCFIDKELVCVKHMPAPLNPEGEPRKWGDREKAIFLNLPLGEFKKRYKRICRRAENAMKRASRP